MKIPVSFPILTLMAASLSVTLPGQAFQNWTSFQNGGNHSLEKSGFPTSWSPDKGIAWQVDLEGYGQSTPLVFEDRVYVTTVKGGNKEQLFLQALSIEDGSELWRYESVNSSPEENNSYVSRAAPSAVCDADGVIAFFEGGNLAALDHGGQVRWELDLTKEFGDVKARHGLAASLEQNADHVFVWIERSADPYVVALSKKDGSQVWKSAGLGGTSWASPRLVPVENGHHLVLSGVGKLAGLDPATGKRLWDFEEVGGNSTPTPMPVGDGRFLVGASPPRGESAGGNASKSNGMIQIASAGEQFQVSWVWQAERATSSFGSPLVHRDKAWYVNRQGVIFCLNLETGEELFAKRSPAGSVWATPLGLGDQVFLFGKDGVTTIIEDAAELSEVSTSELWDQAPSADAQAANAGGPVLYAATPIANGLLLRRGDRLYRVKNE